MPPDPAPRPGALPFSDHFDGERFFNPGQPAGRRSIGAVLRWRLRRTPAPWPDRVPVQPARPDRRVAGLRVTGVGHSTALIQLDGINVLTDPVWSPRASPFRRVGPHRVTEPGIAFDDLPPIDAVLISHCHYDHLDLATLARLHTRDRPIFAVPLGVDAIVRRAIPDARLACGDWWDRLALAPGLATTLTPALHWANRSPFDVRRTLWAGHFVHAPSAALWFAGDTGYGDGAIFGAIRARLGAPALALVPIGAFEPRWFMAVHHCDPAEAVRIVDGVGAGRALGIHWGTFHLSDEARDAPLDALARARAAAFMPPERFVALAPGAVHE